MIKKDGLVCIWERESESQITVSSNIESQAACLNECQLRFYFNKRTQKAISKDNIGTKKLWYNSHVSVKTIYQKDQKYRPHWNS